MKALRYLIICTVICFGYGNLKAQEISSDADSSKVSISIGDSTDSFRFNLELQALHSRLFMRNSLLFPSSFISDYSTVNTDYYRKMELPLSYRMRKNIAYSMEILTEAEYRSGLGIFGEILGYGNTAAAFGLALYHIHKYGLE